MRSLCITALVMFVFTACAPAIPGPDTPFKWVAYPEAGNPVYINPAGFAFLEGLNLRVSIAGNEGEFKGVEGGTVSAFSSSFTGWWDDSQNMRRFSTASGIRLFDDIAAIGLGYTWFEPTIPGSLWEEKHFFIMGMIVRPIEWLSCGITRRTGIELQGEDIEPQYRMGVALRPLGDRFTLTCDLSMQADLDEQKVSGGVEYIPFDGLTIRAEGSSEHINFGIQTDFGHFGIAGAGFIDDAGVYQGTRADIVISSEPGMNLFEAGNRFIRFEPNFVDELKRSSYFGSTDLCFTEYLVYLEYLASDPTVAGVIIDIDGGYGSAAQTEELRSTLVHLREAGKKVYVYFQSGGNGAVYLSSVADNIWIHPCGYVSFIGVASESMFLREFLDNLGIYPDFLHIGEYKSASDMLTRSDMSDAQFESTTALLSSIQDELVRGVASGRGLEPAQLALIIETGPYTAERAVNTGLVDGICYSDEMEEKVEKEYGNSITAISLDDYIESIPQEDIWGMSEHIAVVVATGMIESGESGYAFPFGTTMGSETICDALETAASKPGVKAIILRIDSGGGSALASDDMWHTVETIQEEGIPVIVSMGGVAASGGYYMACGADRIFADRMTITGSIGIITGKFCFGELLDSLGINIEEVSLAPMAALYSQYRPFTDEERARVFDLMEDGYNTFVERVAEGRGMTFVEVDNIGQGRVWSGIDGLEIGIVDEIGGVVDAIEYAIHLGGLDSDKIPDLRFYPKQGRWGLFGIPGFGMFEEEIFRLPDFQETMYLMAPITIR